MKIRNAIILAAGRGLRLMPLTEHLPKPMINVNGDSLISNGIRMLKDKIPHVHITVGYKKALLASHVIQNDVSSVINTEGKSNSWWIHNSLLSYLDEPILVLTCDNIVELDLELLEKDYYEKNEPSCFLVPVKPIEGLEGDYIFHKKNIVYKIDRNSKSDIYCSGIQILNPRKVSLLTSFSENANFYNIWDQLIKKSELVCSEVYPNKWISVDTVENLNKANEILFEKNQ